MFRASLTSKGQITIPKEIRELLHLNTGNIVLFKVDNVGNKVIFEKEDENEKCSLCSGDGIVSNYNEDHQKLERFKCPVCQSSGLIKKNISALDEVINLMKVNLSYHIGVTLIQTDGTCFERKLVPTISLISDMYPPNLLNKIHDYYQVKLIDEYAPRSFDNPEKFMNPSDSELDEMLALLKTEEERQKVLKWFRYTRNIFHPQ